MKMRRIVCCLTVWLTVAVLRAGAQEAGMEMSVFRVPEYDQQGRMVAQLFGRHAEVDSSGEVRIDRLKLEFYQADKLFMTVEAPYCYYDTRKRQAHSDSEVEATGEKIRITGRGFEWQPDAHRVHILSEAQVTVENAGELNHPVLSGGGSASEGPVVITSKELFLDYAQKVVLFETDVLVRRAGGEMRCDRLKVPLAQGGTDGNLLNFPALPSGSESGL